MKPIRIVKGIIFLVIATIFLFVTFYQVNDTVFRIETNSYVDLYAITRGALNYNFSDFIISNIYNYLFSGLFALLGFMELLDSGIIKKVGDNNGN